MSVHTIDPTTGETTAAELEARRCRPGGRAHPGQRDDSATGLLECVNVHSILVNAAHGPDQDRRTASE
jgi:hypothetical protein